MADKTKKQKKPKHTRLVLPGDRQRPAAPETDRLGRALAPGATAGAPGAATPPAAVPATGNGGIPAGKETPGRLPSNAIPLPAANAKKKKRRLSPVKRKRRRRRIQAAALALVAALAVLVYQTGAYARVVNSLSEWIESMQIASRPGDGFPMPLSVTGFVRAEEMPGNGFVALGTQDMAIVSSTGAELRRIQHSYLSPGVSAGAARAVLFSRGGREYTIEGRSETIARHNTIQDIAFAEMSRNGTLALATTSRFSSRLTIMAPGYNNMEPDLEFDIRSGETPFMAAFLDDDRSLALACVSNNGGVTGTTFYLLRTGTDSVVNSFRVDGAVLLQLEYLPAGRLLAVFDSFTALYGADGSEAARYDYSGRSLYTSDVLDGRAALVFGSAAQEMVHAVLLNERLEPQFDLSFQSGSIARTLLCADGMFLLAGQEVLALDSGGALAARLPLEYKPLGLTRGAGPKAITAGRVEDLGPLFNPPSAESISGGQSLSNTDGSAPASTSTENPT